MIKTYWYNSFVPIRSDRRGFRQHVSNRSNTAASKNAPAFGGVTPALKKCGVALFLSIRRLEAARAKVSQPVFRLVCEETKPRNINMCETKTPPPFGVWGKKRFMGRSFMGIIRTTFLINSKGKIHKIWSNVRVKDHAKEVVEEIKNIK